MEERKYKFYHKDKSTRAFYKNVTEEEFNSLKHSYRKEKYMTEEQYFHTSTYTASDIISETDVSEDDVFRDEETDVEAEVIGTDILNGMLDGLSEEEKRVVALCLLGGYTEEEAAGIMEMHKGAVRRRKLSAIKKMREYLEESGLGDYASAKGLITRKVVSSMMDDMFPMNDDSEG